MPAFIPQIPPQIMSKYTDGSPAKPAQQFPPNLAENLTPDIQKKMLMWLNQKYIWPQAQERRAFEKMWDKMLEMARISIPYDDMFDNIRHDATKLKNEADQANKDKARVR